MAPRRSTRVAIAVGASLIATGTALFTGGHADALTVPGVNVTVPGVNVTVPGVNVTVPGVNVTVPGVNVTVPGVNVTVPGVNVTVPGVNVTVPGVNVTVPSAPAASGTEPPVTTEPPAPPAGGGAPASPSTPPPASAGGSASSPAASSAHSSTALPSSHSPLATTVQQTSSAGGGQQPRSSTRRSAQTHPHRAHRAHRPSTEVVSTGDVARAHPSSPRVTRETRAATHTANDPLDAIGRHIPLPIPVPDWSKPIIAVLLLLALWFGVRSRLAARRARHLEGQRATLLHDLGVMQMALVPEVPASLGGLAVSVAYRPAEGPAAGGDFYDVFIPEPGKVAIILGDVAGHGHQALNHAALTRYTLRAYIQAGLEPRVALALAGRVFADPDAEHYATVAVAVYHTRDNTLTYALAGHPPPIVRGFDVREHVGHCSSPPIGWTAPTGRRQTTISLPADAVVCFFSDGLPEARCEEELLGRERLTEILTALGPQPNAATLLDRVTVAAEATPDDMAACIFTPQATTSVAHTHVEELEVDTQTLSRPHIRRFLEAYQLPTLEIARAIKHASHIAAASGTALLRLELESATVTVTATTPGTSGPLVVAA